MAPFLAPKVVASGLKERFESLTVQADRLYLGSSTGNLHVYSLQDTQEGSDEHVLLEVKKGLVKRSIDQLGFIRDVNSLVVLSEMTVTLFPLPNFSPATPLPAAKAAFSFAIHSSVQHTDPPSSLAPESLPRAQPSIPTLVTQLLVGCRRKAVLYCWKDGELQDVKEAPLPHSARVIVFIDKDTACFAYSPTEFSMFSIPTMTATDITTPIVVSSSGAAMTALSGLTGYMTLGLGAKAKPAEVQVSDTEVLISKDGQGHFVGLDGKISRTTSVDWPAPPEEIAFVKPYILSVLPAGSVPTRGTEAVSISPAATAQTTFNATSLIQIRSSLSLQTCQSLSYPFDTPGATATQNGTIRLLTPSPNAGSPLYMLTTPLDRTAAANDGSKLWSVSLKLWSEQIDELVLEGQYQDALDLLETIQVDSLPDKDQRRIKIKALNTVAQFRTNKFDAAIDTFIELDFNPAKVVALYPESVAGRLSVPREEWIPLYGGPAPPVVEPPPAPSSDGDKDNDSSTGHDRQGTDLPDSTVAGGSIGGRFRKAGLAILKSQKDDDTASITSKRRFPPHDDFHRSVETLVRYLSDKRPKLRAALEAVGITTESQSHLASPLSEASLDELFTLPNAPLSALTPNQLLRFAQIVDTALYKSYLIIRPGLLGPLCRIANWCEVSEVEEDLHARKKFNELRDLYHGKKMHAKALQLLKELAEDETDKEDKLEPSIQYLQRLGQDYINLTFEHGRWLFDVDSDMAFQIFTSEDVELDRASVADYLEGINPLLCAKYLEFIIAERSEQRTGFHDRLGELYLNITLAAKKRNDEKARKDMYHQLLVYIDTDQYFAIDRLYALVSAAGEMHEARAILLGRLGRHDQALETYVYRLHDYQKAEEYSKHIYHPNSETSNIFFTLLRIYLRPTVKTDVDLLQPALDLISRHGPRLDAVETLQLLPPLVTMDDIKAFLVDALRAPVFDTAVIRNISKARSDHVSRKLMSLQTRRVKITDSRICPHCHKRLGNSVIAVHAPRGEVTHYQCREAFSKRSREVSGA